MHGLPAEGLDDHSERLLDSHDSSMDLVLEPLQCKYPKGLVRLWCKVASKSGNNWNVLPWRELCATMGRVSLSPKTHMLEAKRPVSWYLEVETESTSRESHPCVTNTCSIRRRERGCESQLCEDSEKRMRKAAFRRHQMYWHFDAGLPSLQECAK